MLSAARLIVAETQQQVLDPPTRLSFSGVQDGRGLRFDLGAALPVVEVDLQWSTGTHVAPLRIQGRNADDEPWREIAPAVFYRLERPEGASVSPAIEAQASQRLLRLLPDERSAALEPAAARLVVQAQLASLVFAAQGKPPFIEASDVEAAMKTAAAIGDDTLQRRATGHVVPDSFTHGSSEQRQRWFQTGFKDGTVKACNTFAAPSL